MSHKLHLKSLVVGLGLATAALACAAAPAGTRVLRTLQRCTPVTW
ncbi:MAG TPA: hypothetical protein VIG31_10330 [Rhodanobacteraceae bacterium]|jgi:hypothetical protein